MQPSKNGSHGFEVSWPNPVLDQLNRWTALAERVGQRAAFAAALRETRERLATDPRNWGDPVRSLRGMDAVFFRRCGSVLVVTYAVHNVRPVVFIQQVKLTPGSVMQDAEHDPPVT